MPGTVESLSVASEVLRANPLGDPWARTVPVYLPPSYGTGANRYPVIYCLSGYSGSGLSWLSFVPFGENLPQRMDRLIAAGAPEAILVMVDAYTKLGGSQYVNSPAIGRYEDHIVQELVPFIASRFRTSGRSGLIGKSSGGYGALVLAMRHPKVFSALACHAGDMYFEYCYKHDVPRLASAIARAGDAKRLLEGILAKPKRSGEDFALLSMLCACAAYLPDASRPLGVGLPFDEAGAIDDAAWKRFCTHDPIALAPHHADALRKLSLLYFEAGTRDEHNLHLGARILARKLRELGVPFTHEEFDDGHRDTAYRYDLTLPMLTRALLS